MPSQMTMNSEWKTVKTILSVRGGKKHSLNLISQVEFAALEIRKTKPLTSILGSIDMDIILRITMEPQSVNVIFIFVIITTSNILSHVCSHTGKDVQQWTYNSLLRKFCFFSPFSLFLPSPSHFYNSID